MEIPKLYSYFETLEAYLENAANVTHEQELQGISTLEFDLPLTDPKAADVVNQIPMLKCLVIPVHGLHSPRFQDMPPVFQSTNTA